MFSIRNTLIKFDHILARSWSRKSVITELIMKSLLSDGRLAIVDCGGGGGSFSEWTNPMGDIGQSDRFAIYGFDPDEIECTRLNTQARIAGHQHYYYPLCIAERDETARSLYLTHFWGCNSLYRPDEALIARWKQSLIPGKPVCALDSGKVKQIVQVSTTSLDTWARNEKISSIDFMKLDVQGSELECLKGGRQLLSSCLGLLVEVWFVPYYENQPLFADIDVYLRDQKFTLFSHYIYYRGQFAGRMKAPVAFDSDFITFRQQQAAGQLITTDALYLRDPISCPDPKMDASQILKLICLAEICQQVEYAFELMVWLRDGLLQSGNAQMASQMDVILGVATRYYQRRPMRLLKFLRQLALRGPV